VVFDDVALSNIVQSMSQLAGVGVGDGVESTYATTSPPPPPPPTPSPPPPLPPQGPPENSTNSSGSTITEGAGALGAGQQRRLSAHHGECSNSTIEGNDTSASSALTVVNLVITTTNAGTYQQLTSAWLTNQLAATQVTNGAGQSIVACEVPLVAGSRAVLISPSMPPPVVPSPMPPMEPPDAPPVPPVVPNLLRTFSLSDLRAVDYVNVSNPGTVALGKLLNGQATAGARTARAITVGLAVVISLGTTTMASVGGSAVSGGAAAGLASALPAMMSASRFAMYGKLGNAALTAESASSGDDPTGWMSGSLGFNVGTTIGALVAGQSGRRLDLSDANQSDAAYNGSYGSGANMSIDEAAGNASSTADVEARIRDALLAVHADRLLSMLAVMCGVVLVQYIILLGWWFKWKRFEHAAAKWEQLHGSGVRMRLFAAEGLVQIGSSGAAIFGKHVSLIRRPTLASGISGKKDRTGAIEGPKKKASVWPLPAVLCTPNPQVAIVLIFASGVVESSVAILGAWAGAYNYVFHRWHVAIAFTSLSLVAIFFAWQLRALLVFYRTHRRVAWVPNKVPAQASEVEDPLLALLTKLRLPTPRLREKGVFETPKELVVEPLRTESALNRHFVWCKAGEYIWRPFRRQISRLAGGRAAALEAKRRQTAGRASLVTSYPGFDLERLLAWVDGSSGTRVGACYVLVQVIFQMCIAVNTGFLYAHPFAPTNDGQVVQLSVLVALTTSASLFAALGTANDLWEGWSTAAVYVLEAAAMCHLLSATLAQRGTNVTDSEQRELNVLVALRSADAAAQLLSACSYIPLGVATYDAIVVPVVTRMRAAESSDPRAIAWELLLALLGSLNAILTMFGVKGSNKVSKALSVVESVTNVVVMESTISRGSTKLSASDIPPELRGADGVEEREEGRYVPCDCFDGPRPGYVFQNGADGLGYYLDRLSGGSTASIAAPAAVSSTTTTCASQLGALAGWTQIADADRLAMARLPPPLPHQRTSTPISAMAEGRASMPSHRRPPSMPLPSSPARVMPHRHDPPPDEVAQLLSPRSLDLMVSLSPRWPQPGASVPAGVRSRCQISPGPTRVSNPNQPVPTRRPAPSLNGMALAASDSLGRCDTPSMPGTPGMALFQRRLQELRECRQTEQSQPQTGHLGATFHKGPLLGCGGAGNCL